MEGLGIASKGLLCGLKEHEDPPHTPGGHVEVEIPEGVALILAVSQYPVAQYRESPFVLVGDHSGQIRLSDNGELQTDVFDPVRDVGSGLCYSCSQDHTAVVIEGQLVLESVAERALVEWHVSLEYLDIQRDMEPIRERIGDDLVGRNSLISVSSANSNPRCVPGCGHVNALVVAVLFLRGRPLEVGVQ